jgi:ABC-type sugar transport system ATPase subunit
VYQDLALVNQLTVYQNMFLNRELVRWPLLRNRAMRKRAKEQLDSMGISTLKSVDLEVASLSGGQRQAIAVARSVFSEAKVLLLDEPLAAMGVKEGAAILDLVRDLKEQGISIIIIAHNYGQVFPVCDRVNLLQGGKITFDKYSRDTSVEELTNIVVAEYRKALEERHRAAAPEPLAIPGASAPVGHDGGHVDLTRGRPPRCRPPKGPNGLGFRHGDHPGGAPGGRRLFRGRRVLRPGRPAGRREHGSREQRGRRRGVGHRAG